jgi:hypothetical protein
LDPLGPDARGGDKKIEVFKKTLPIQEAAKPCAIAMSSK